jgi:hypothetical protein
MRHTLVGFAALLILCATLLPAPQTAWSDPDTNPFVVAAGDIACSADFSPGGTGVHRGATKCHEDATSNLFSSTGPLSAAKALIPLGDTQYENGTTTDYTTNGSSCVLSPPYGDTCSYDQSWTATAATIGASQHPAAGNHEYQNTGAGGCTLTSGTGTNACGYESYFNQSVVDPQNCQSGTTPEPAGDYCWYLNPTAAHPALFVSVNAGNCDNDSTCKAGGSSATWLHSILTDGTINAPADCVVVYWHQARWAYYGARGNDPNVDGIWQALFSASTAKTPDLVLAAHDHNYQRFGTPGSATYAGLDSGGNSSGSGIMEIIVGTGGRSLDTSVASSSPVPTFSDVNDFGVLELLLNGTTGKLTPSFWREADTTAFDTPGAISCHT